MRIKAFTLFDEFVGAGVTTYTNAETNAPLGAYDQLALHVIVDNVSAGGTVNLFVEHSGDSKHWMQRNSMVLGTPGASATGDISLTVASAGAYQLLWADACVAPTGQVVYTGGATSPRDTTNTPLLPFVRLRIVTSGAACHVKIIATQRGAQ
jgi:hypothetical protein